MSEEKKMPFFVDGDMGKEEMGETISLYRKRISMSEEDFAEAIGCSPKILKSAENGKGNHVYGTLMKVCNKFSLQAKMSIEEIETIV